MTGVELIESERLRQVTEEGRTAAHDAQHVGGELLEAAIAYAKAVELRRVGFDAAHVEWAVPREMFAGVRWPSRWDADSFKPGDDVRDLARAGALIAAEIDRLQRAEAHRV